MSVRAASDSGEADAPPARLSAAGRLRRLYDEQRARSESAIIHREQIWTLLAALGWLAFFALTIAYPIALDERQSVGMQVASVAIGIVMLNALLLISLRPYWPLWGRLAMAGSGVLIVLSAYFINARESWVYAFVALALLLISLPVGYWLGEKMERATNLVPLAIAMSLADIFSVAQGPTKKLVSDLKDYQQEVAQVARQHGAEAAALVKSPLLDYIAVHVPLAGAGHSSPVLGIGDFVILAFLFRSAWVHHISAGKVFFFAVFFTLAALGTVILLGRELPALPFIGLGTVLALLASEPRMRRLSRQEIVLSIAVTVIFGVLIGVKLI